MQQEPDGISRRDFIKTASLATGGALLMTTVTPPHEEAFAATSEDPLTGVSDIHIHATPDSRPRSKTTFFGGMPTFIRSRICLYPLAYS